MSRNLVGLISFLLIPIISFAQPGQKILVQDGIEYEVLDDMFVRIKSFKQISSDFTYVIKGKVRINQREYLVKNKEKFDEESAKLLERLEVLDLSDSVFCVSRHLEQFRNLHYLKLPVEALGNFRDYRNVTQYFDRSSSYFPDLVFEPMPDWVMVKDGVHYSADGSRLLYFAKCTENSTLKSKGRYFLPFHTTSVAPYSIMPRSLCLCLPYNLRDFSLHQHLGYSITKDYARIAFACIEPVEYFLHFEFDPDADKNWKNTTRFFFHLPSTIARLQKLYDRKPQISSNIKYWVNYEENRKCFETSTLVRSRIFATGGGRFTLTKKNFVKNSIEIESKTVKNCENYEDDFYIFCDVAHIVPEPVAGKRFVGFALWGDTLLSQDLVFTPFIEEYCNVELIFADEGAYVEGIDYLLSGDKSTLIWWRNLKNESDIRVLNRPQIKRIGENCFRNPIQSKWLRFPEGVSTLESNALSNQAELELISFESSPEMEKGALGGCRKLRAIHIGNKPGNLTAQNIKDAFSPSSIPDSLIICGEEEYSEDWKSIADEIGLPVHIVPNEITLKNNAVGRVEMHVFWRKDVNATEYHEVVGDIVKIPAFSVYYVTFDPTLEYDFLGTCQAENQSFSLGIPRLATRSYEFEPSCKRASYTINVAPVTGGVVEIRDENNELIDPNERIQRGKKLIISAIPDIYNEFKSITLNFEDIFKNPVEHIVRSPILLSASFSPKMFPLKIVQDLLKVNWKVRNELGNLLHDGDQLKAGKSVLIDAIPPKGWKVKRWFINGEEQVADLPYKLIVTEGIDLSAECQPELCQITVQEDSKPYVRIEDVNGNVINQDESIQVGKELVVKASVPPGHLLKAFRIGTVDHFNVKEVRVLADPELIISVQIVEDSVVLHIPSDIRYSVKITADPPLKRIKGTVGMWSGLRGQNVQLTVEHSGNWEITKLFLDDEVFIGSSIEFSLDANRSFLAELKTKTYKLKIDKPTRVQGELYVLDQYGEKLQAKNELTWLEPLRVIAAPKPGYKVVRIMVNDRIFSSDQIDLQVNGNLHISALFLKREKNVRYDFKIVADTLVTESMFQGDTLQFASDFELSSVRRVGANAFAYTIPVRHIRLDGAVNYVEVGAFYGCPKVSSIYIGPNVRKINAMAFAEMPRLRIIDVDQLDPSKLKVDPSVFIDYRGSHDYCYFRVPRAALKEYRDHPDWKAFSVVPDTAVITFRGEGRQGQICIEAANGGWRKNFIIKSGWDPLYLPGGTELLISNAPNPFLRIKSVQLVQNKDKQLVTPLPLYLNLMDDLSIYSVQTEPETDESLKKNPITSCAQDQETIRCWPNPFSSQIVVENSLDGIISYELADAMGGVICRGQFEGYLFEIPTSGMASGVYILTCRGNGLIRTYRLIKL